MTRGRTLAIAALAILTIAAAPLLGTWVLGVATILVALAALAAGRGGVWTGAALALGLLGGLAGAGVALAALRFHAGDPRYAERAWVGIIALALALLAAVGATLVPARPKLAATLLVVGSALGFVAINFYDINTPYFVAPPACWIAAALALAARGATQPPASLR